MMTKANERETLKIENMSGGAGYILKEVLLGKEEMGEYCKLFGQVTLKPGCEIGYHEHHGETETYYIVKGSGVYTDNGEKYPVETGDVTFCKEGSGHGLLNTGDEDMVIIALILFV